MVLTTTQVLPALSFTLGCFAIHTLRTYADRLTVILIGLVVVLSLATAAVGMNQLLVEPDESPAIGIDLSQAL